jgi:acyl dehydratase
MMGRHVQVGDHLPPLVKPAIERIQLVRYAGASGDFNPIHVDEEFARNAGYRSVFAHGMLSMGFLGQFLSDWAGPAAVRRLQVRFKAITWPGDVITCHGEVVEVTEQAPQQVVELKLWTENQAGAVTVEGSATVLL